MLASSKPGVPPGDVTFIVKAQKHESFERMDNDLITHVTITLSEALLGFSRILLKHLDGRGIKVSSPPGKVVKPQETIILKGEGMPIYKRPDQKGDLYVILDLEMPDEQWMKSVDLKVPVSYRVIQISATNLFRVIQALQSLLPPKKKNIEPLPEIVDEVDYEESDIAELRSTFLDHGFGDESDWEDDDDDDEDEPECRPQ